MLSVFTRNINMFRCPPAVRPPVLPTPLRPIRPFSNDAARKVTVRAASSCPETRTGPAAIPQRRHLLTTLQSQLSALQHMDIAPLQEAVSSEALDAMRRCSGGLAPYSTAR